MIASDLKLKKRFTRNGEGDWRVRSYHETPSCTMINDATGETAEFGMNGTLAEEFVEKDCGGVRRKYGKYNNSYK